MNREKTNAPYSAGSLFMVGLPGPDLDESTRQLITDLGIHNFILFRRNVRDKDQLAGLTRDLHRLCLDMNLPAPLIAIDHEGGAVCRLPDSFTRIPSAMELASQPRPEEEISRYASVAAMELGEVGINMNLAPVLDVCPRGKGFFMEDRSFGGEPARVTELGGIFIRESRKCGVIPCGKHFPGLGRAVLDPHKVLPVISRSEELIKSEDLLPFKAAAASGLPSFMTSHAVYEQLDPERPATLSPYILQDLLRKWLGFEGLLVSDDLEMGAIEGERTVAQAAVEAFRAGVDLLLICEDHEKVRASWQAFSRISDSLLMTRVRESLERQRRAFAM